MSKSNKKPKLSDILGTKLTDFVILKGKLHQLEDGSDCPKLWVKGTDEEEADLYENTFQYGFIGKAIDSIEERSSFAEDDPATVNIQLPYPTKKSETEINWINYPF